MSKGNLIKFISYLVVVGLIFFVFDRSLSLGLRRIVKNSEFRFSRLYQGGVDANIVIIGNSRAVNAFYVPKIEKELNRSVFHLGYNGMSMEVADTLFADYLQHNARPEQLLVEITNLSVGNALVKDLKPYYGFSSNLMALSSDSIPEIYAATKVAHLYRFNGELFLRSLFYMKQSDQSWINRSEIDPAFAGSFLSSVDERNKRLFPVEGQNWNSLISLITLCEQNDVELELIISPYLPALREAYIYYESDLKRMEENLPFGTRVWDYSNALNSSTNFADPLHINRKGAEKLFETMLQDGLFAP